jgi:hypothetical protein
MKLSLLSCVVFTLLVAGCTKSSSSTAPTPPPATRIIRLGGNLNFGAVAYETGVQDGVLTVSNDGTENLDITGMGFATTLPNSPEAPNLSRWCFDMLQPLSSVRFAVAPGDTVPVGFRFAPKIDPARGMVPRPPTFQYDCSGRITVSGNPTSGTNTIGVIAFAGP